MYYGARYYLPSLRRFISADSVVSSLNPQALNRFAYVLNRPLNFIDPTGHVALIDGYAPVSSATNVIEKKIATQKTNQIILSKPMLAASEPQAAEQAYRAVERAQEQEHLIELRKTRPPLSDTRRDAANVQQERAQLSYVEFTKQTGWEFKLDPSTGAPVPGNSECAFSVHYAMVGAGNQYAPAQNTNAFNNADSAFNYWKEHGGVEIQESEFSALQVGDLIFYGDGDLVDDRQYEHVAMVVDMVNGVPYVSDRGDPEGNPEQNNSVQVRYDLILPNAVVQGMRVPYSDDPDLS
jgi:hypothetical protein